MTHVTREELEAGLDAIRKSPKDGGLLRLIVRRPRVNEREVLEQGDLDPAAGLAGDKWALRVSRGGRPASASADAQLTLMNARAIALIAGSIDRWPLAGDQLFVDLDLSGDNLPAGVQLAVGSAIIEVTPQPHTGCGKFAGRFGTEAMTFVNSPVGRQLQLRGIYAKIVQAGRIRVGDLVQKV
jgi:MOSC domain-containing protein YiiM